ncbi:MAG: hypothetical protein PHC75_08460 [Burkholderiales bacterium]|nr:hypothetical protein [Burkholderiales bacterium]
MQLYEFKLPATLNKNNVASVLKVIDLKLQSSSLEVKCDDVVSIDSSGIALLIYLTNSEYKTKLKLSNINTKILELCQLYHVDLSNA